MTKLFGYLEGFLGRFWASMDDLMGAAGAVEVKGWFSTVWNYVVWVLKGDPA